MNNGLMVAIEGLIGAGKSTLVRNLAEHDVNIQPLYEPVEANPFLELYYNDPKRWAYAMQVNLLFERYNMTQDAYQQARKGLISVLDRSIFGDAAFALVQWHDGYFTKEEFNSYINMHKTLVPTAHYPDILFWLELNPKDALERIQNRSRGCEAGIPYKYLEELYDAYMHILSKLEGKCPIIKIDARADADSVYEAVYSVIKEYQNRHSENELLYR